MSEYRWQMRVGGGGTSDQTEVYSTHHSMFASNRMCCGARSFKFDAVMISPMLGLLV